MRGLLVGWLQGGGGWFWVVQVRGDPSARRTANPPPHGPPQSAQGSPKSFCLCFGSVAGRGGPLALSALPVDLTSDEQQVGAAGG